MEYITFHLNEFYLGIAATDVLEVNRGFQITPIPKSPAIVRGVVNLRGEIILAIDMHARFQLQRHDQSENLTGVILSCKRMTIAAIVDQVGDIIELHEDTFELPPSNFPQASRELILGVHKLSEKLLIIVDAQKIWSDSTLAQERQHYRDGMSLSYQRLAP